MNPLSRLRALSCSIILVLIGLEGQHEVSRTVGDVAIAGSSFPAGALLWPAALIYAAVWLFLLLTLRISSLAGMTAAVSAPIVAWANVTGISHTMSFSCRAKNSCSRT